MVADELILLFFFADSIILGVAIFQLCSILQPKAFFSDLPESLIIARVVSLRTQTLALVCSGIEHASGYDPVLHYKHLPCH